jgi:hypothetical protein
MYDELHPEQRDETPAQVKQREARLSSAIANPLRIASEYEAAFDRRKLDLLIRAQNPDSDHQPGRLHNLLLQLPWADVFTTNYDTLLERTEVPGRTYHPVTKASELTTAFAPRIVKLHGSFPSQSPFIITEEDYRTYPRKFAPFVNSVQQSLLENSFVLIGFSGDDPNFLEWTGWIRDELGGNHAPIYLVGPLHIGDAERSLLARRGVTAIDLAPVFEGIPTPDGMHPVSIEWFLNCLMAARQPRPEKWPNVNQCPPSVADSRPPIVDAGVAIPETADPSPRGPLNAESVAKVVKRWHWEREEYPGWIVTPEWKRTELWHKTKYWFLPLISFAKDWPVANRILLFREIIWRLERIMAPLFAETIEPFQSTLDEVFDILAQGQSITGSPDLPVAINTQSSDIADAWLEIAFALLRDARESYLDTRWNELKSRIDKVVHHHKRHSDRNQYEAALQAMWNVNRGSAKAILSQWQPSSRFPLAMIWKAGLLAELENADEARTILRSALREIRRGLQNEGQNIELLSLEGWCTYLLACVESSLNLARYSTVRDEFEERWQELKARDCDPWSYMEDFEQALSGSPPKQQKVETEIRGFDPGDVTVSRHMGSGEIDPYLPGFACIRLFEQVGMPTQLPIISISGDTLKNACRWVAPFIGFWSPALLIRAGKLDDLKEGEFLSRTQVAAMDSALAKRLYTWCLQILERELSFLVGVIAIGSAQGSLLGILSEVLSRLAFKVGTPELERTFPLVLRLHGHSGVRSHGILHELCEPWFRRLFQAADNELLFQWLPQLIKAPLFDEGIQPWIPPGQAWPDPMRHYPNPRVPGLREIHPEVTANIDEATDWLLRRAASESGEGRRRAIDRLVDVYHADLMTTDQQRQFGDLLWNQRTAANLPDRPGFAAFGFLHLPAPAGIDVPSIVKKHILSLPSKGVVTRGAKGGISAKVGPSEQGLILEASVASRPIVRLKDEKIGTVDWTSEEARVLYYKARDWWANDKAAFELAKTGPFGLVGIDFVKNTIRTLGQFLARIVLPRMEWADENEWQQLLGWIEEMRSFGAYPTSALPYVLLQRPSEAEAVARTITDDVNSEVELAVAAAAKAIRHWIHLSAAKRVSPPLPNLMTTLIERVVFRRKPGINSCLRQLACLITERQEAVTLSQADLLTASLVFWHHATILPVPDEGAGDFHEAERPALRVHIAELASALKIWHAKSSPEAPEPPSITLWRDLCASDPLPEIRRAFNARERVVA